jgi:hypothetical protein
MTGWAIFGVITAAVLVLTIAGFTLASSKDITRYIKIGNM